MIADLNWMDRPQRRPATDMLGFDPRLMDAERLLSLAGRHRLRLGEDGDGGTWLDCCECGKGVVKLADRCGHWAVEPLQLICDVLRHQVMRHQLSLSGGD